MNIRSEDLIAHLKQKLLPVYVVSGDEPLLLGEACDVIRHHAKQVGFNERQVMHVEKGFDWDQFLSEINSMSLFAEQKLIEIRLPGGKPGDKGAKALQLFAQDPPPDTVLLLICGKLDKATQKTKWFSAIDSIGASVQVWPVEAKALPQWIHRRMQQKGLNSTREAEELLSERIEGNLLAAAQEIDKLALSHGNTQIDFEVMESIVADSARYDIFGLVDAAMIGDVKRVTRMLNGLRAEGSEPVLLLWAITREIRSLSAMSKLLTQGERLEQVLAKYRVWAKRKPLVSAALRRHKHPTWAHLLQKCANLDRIIKGMKTGNVWDELLQLCLYIAGVKLFSPQREIVIA